MKQFIDGGDAPRPSARSAVVAALAAGVAMAAVGCGSGGGSPPGNRLTIVDYDFQPDAFTAPAGTQVTIGVTNKGKVTHNISIPSLGVDVDFQAGQATNLIFVAPQETGSLELFCKYHRDRGMTGAFFVRGR